MGGSMEAKPKIIEEISRCRQRGVPIISVTSADQAALASLIKAQCNGSVPLIRHDVIHGAIAMNDPGSDAIAALQCDVAQTQSPVEWLALCERLQEKTLVIMMNAQLWLGSAQGATQAVSNLRDLFKSDQRTLILLSPQLQIPLELQSDIVPLDESLPDRQTIRSIVKTLLDDAALPADDSTLDASAEALVGLCAFSAEQAAALSLRRDGLSLEACWERKKKQVEQTRGLKMSASKVRFSDLGGLASSKEYFSKAFKGPMSPKLILRIEEIEKMVAGTGSVGDSSGVSQDQLQVLLDRIESNHWIGCLFLGPGGSGKSYFSEALAGEFNVKAISFDLGAMKGSLVGESEAAIRNAFGVVEAIGGSNVLVVATCNGLQELRPELQRRLASAGMWYFDLPDSQEKTAIWPIQMKAWNLADQPIPNDVGWSSSDIRDCCRTAYLLGETLMQASIRVNSAMSREPERINSLRKLASGRLSSASYPGAYRMPSLDKQIPKGRGISSFEEL
jgi:hypothetical protein